VLGHDPQDHLLATGVPMMIGTPVPLPGIGRSLAQRSLMISTPRSNQSVAVPAWPIPAHSGTSHLAPFRGVELLAEPVARRLQIRYTW